MKKAVVLLEVYEQIKPLYSFYLYRDGFCKVVKFKRSPSSSPKLGKSKNEKEGDRFLSSLSRARSSVLSYALSNPWDWFFTGTISPAKMDRFDITKFSSRLSQWIRDERKRTGSDIKYLLVPERHRDGAWHCHGLLSGLPFQDVTAFVPGVHPDKLCKGHYKNWSSYERKFGYCSLGQIQDPVKVAFYITKYITKELGEQAGPSGRNLYFHSKGLQTKEHYGDWYTYNKSYEDYLSHDYDFCSLGYGRISWDTACDLYEGPAPLEKPVPKMVKVDIPEDDFDWFQMQSCLWGDEK